MARMTIEQADKAGGQGGGGFFSLKNDKDVARVRFLFNSADEVSAQSVHQVEVDGKKRWVSCLREYGDPVDACPLCKARDFLNIKYFIPLYNIDADTTQVWERGKTFGSKISSICSRYPNIVSHVFEIERNGKAGDQRTSYEIYETGETEGVTVEDFDFQDPIGTVVMLKSFEDLQYYAEHRRFPNSEGSSDRGNSDSAPAYQRRTPAGGQTRREAF